MSRVFTILENEMKEIYFPALRRADVYGIIMPYDRIFPSNIAYANQYDIPVWISYNVTEQLDCKYLYYGKMGVEGVDGKFECFAFDELKNYIKKLPKEVSEGIQGVILKYPRYSNTIWDESFRDAFYDEFQNYIEDYLGILFELTDKKVAFRNWYYELCHNFIYSKYVKPAVTWAKKRKLKLCFDIGEEKSHYSYLKKQIFCMNLLENGVSLSVKHQKGNISEVSVLLSKYDNDSFVFMDENDESLHGLDVNLVGTIETVDNNRLRTDDKVLLVRCDRGVAEKFVLDEEMYFTNECRGHIASFESTFYTDMLFKKGFDFVITNEKYFEKYSKYKNGVYTYKNQEIGQILLCESCVFTDEAINILKKLESKGIPINSKSLEDILCLDDE